MSSEIPEEIPEEEMILSRDEGKEDLGSQRDFENARLLDHRENPQEESYATEAAQALEAKFGRSLGEQTFSQEYELRLNAQGEVIYLKDLSKGEPPQRMTKDGERIPFTSEKTAKDTENFLGATEFARELLANNFITHVDENNPDQGSYAAIIDKQVENGITYIRYTSECYRAAPLDKSEVEEITEDVSPVPSAESPMKVAPVNETKFVFENLFGTQGFAEKSVAEIIIKDETIPSPAEFSDLATLFPSSVTAVSGNETAQASPIGIFQEVAAAPVGTEVVIPGEPALLDLEDASQAVQDAMVVRRLASGISVSFIEATPLSPATSRPEVSSQIQVEAAAPAEANHVEENMVVLTLPGQPDTQPGIGNEQPLPAIDGLPTATHHVNSPPTSLPKPVLAEPILVSVVTASPALYVPSLSPRSGPPSPAQKMPVNISEKVTVLSPDDASEQPFQAILTPGVRMVETSFAPFLDPSRLNTTDPPLPQIVGELPIVFEQAPPQLEKRSDSIDVVTTVSLTHEPVPLSMVSQEKMTSVQHEPAFQPQPRQDIQDNIAPAFPAVSREPLQTTTPSARPIFVAETILSDLRESVVATVEPILTLAQPERSSVPAVVSSQERVGSEPLKLKEQPHPEKPEQVRIAPVETKPDERHVVATPTGTIASAPPEPAYLLAPLIMATPHKPRHIIRIEATNSDKTQQPPAAPPTTRQELLSEIRRRGGSPGSRGNRAAQIVAAQSVRTTTQAA